MPTAYEATLSEVLGGRGVADEDGDSAGSVFGFIGSSLYGVGIISARTGAVNCSRGMIQGPACHSTDLQTAPNTSSLSLKT